MNPGVKSLGASAVGFLILFSFVTSAFAFEKMEYQGAGKRDPFIPLIGADGVVSAGPDATGLAVEGIVYDPRGGSLALINGEYYKEGARVQNMSLISILRDRVILTQDDEEKVLWIREEIVQQGEKNAQNSKPDKNSK